LRAGGGPNLLRQEVFERPIIGAFEHPAEKRGIDVLVVERVGRLFVHGQSAKDRVGALKMQARQRAERIGECVAVLGAARCAKT